MNIFVPKMKFRISIITVCLNSGLTIEHTLSSIISQTYTNIELIVIDGGSTDNTLDIIKKFEPNISFFSSGKDFGIYDAMNKGISAATGDIVGILNSDDLYCYDEYISDIVDLFNTSLNPDLVYSDLVYVDYLGTKIIRNWVAGSYGKYSFKLGWMPPHPTVFVKKDIYNIAGSFNINLKYSADYEFLIRVIEGKKFKAAYLPKVGVKMRVGGLSNASIKNRLHANQEDRLAWRINKLDPWPITFLLKPLRKIFQFKLLN